MNFFIELLQIGIGTREMMSSVPSADEWKWLIAEAQRQAILAIMLCGVERLPKERQPPQPVLLQWIGMSLQIEQQNALTTKVCGQLCQQFDKDGFFVCVLKGQANHRYYPENLQNRRSCGDIDIWLILRDLQHEKSKLQVRKSLEYVDAHWERTGLCWLHCNFTDSSGVPVEVHFHPSFFSRPKYNKRFQSYFFEIEKCVERVKIDGIEIPTMKVEKDVIYQMNHIYRHLIDEGVGLRQVVDYYWLLRKFCSKYESSLMAQKLSVNKAIEWLGMKRFAGALMYVLRELLGMPEMYLLCQPSEKDGKFLVEEILMSGNFGHGDPRMGNVAQGGYIKSRISQAWRRFKRNLRFVSSYPGEVIWEPIVRVEHFAWKKLGMWKR